MLARVLTHSLKLGIICKLIPIPWRSFTQRPPVTHLHCHAPWTFAVSDIVYHEGYDAELPSDIFRSSCILCQKSDTELIARRSSQGIEDPSNIRHIWTVFRATFASHVRTSISIVLCTYLSERRGTQFEFVASERCLRFHHDQPHVASKIEIGWIETIGKCSRIFFYASGRTLTILVLDLFAFGELMRPVQLGGISNWLAN